MFNLKHNVCEVLVQDWLQAVRDWRVGRDCRVIQWLEMVLKNKYIFLILGLWRLYFGLLNGYLGNGEKWFYNR